jgi:hypothetical protein
MLLILGHPDDPLVQEIRRQLAGNGTPIHCLDEPDLFTSSFAFEQKGTSSGGRLHIDGKSIHLDELVGVLVRLPRVWWPSTELDMQDQVFVYHETSAAWFALLTSLTCTVVNRFDLAWWLNDITYPDTLVHGLARKLELHTQIDPPSSTLPPRILPKLPSASCTSVYVAGEAIIPRTIEDKEAASSLTSHSTALADWQRETGAKLSRLDFTRQRSDLFLHHVEVFPLLHEEPPALINQLAAATTEMLL